MLILSRKADESLIIGDEVKLTILSIKGKQVRIGITAPDNISVHREEVYQKIKNEEESRTEESKDDSWHF